jgi:hypothetical protein
MLCGGAAHLTPSITHQLAHRPAEMQCVSLASAGGPKHGDDAAPRILSSARLRAPLCSGVHEKQQLTVDMQNTLFHVD